MIIKGDTLEVLKSIDSDSIDMGVTSPPYNKKITKGGKNAIFGPIKYDSISDDLPEEVYQKNQIDILNELYRTIRPGGSFFYNHKVRHLKGICTFPLEWLTKCDWHIRQEIIWDRQASVEVGGYRFYQVDERIYWLYKPIENNLIGKKIESKHAICSSVWRFPPDRKNSHPAPFPIVLPLRCILSILNGKRGIVIDPYMGSGTTAIASRLLNCDYIGIEISEKYIKQSKERIKKYKNYEDVLKIELESHKVKKPYKERKKQKEGQLKHFFEV